MDVTWLGHSCFRLRGRGAVVVTDPYPPALGPRLRLEADVVTVSHHHRSHDHVQAVKEALVIDTPGEFEHAGVVVRGLPSFHDGRRGADHGRNTIYVVEIDDVAVCHLGDLGHPLDDETVDDIGKVDVLLVPAGGSCVLDGARAAEVVRQVAPRFVVPMHYDHPLIKRELGPVRRFLEEMGVAEIEPQSRLGLQPSQAEDETRVVLLEPRA